MKTSYTKKELDSFTKAELKDFVIKLQEMVEQLEQQVSELDDENLDVDPVDEF